MIRKYFINQFPVLAIILIAFASCNSKSTDCKASYELTSDWKDTFNLIDCSGKKQGLWIPSRTNKLKDTVYYRNDTLIEN